MISSEKSMVDLVDFKGMSSRESFLVENSNGNSSDTVSLRSPDDLGPFFSSYGATTFTINQNFAPEEQGASAWSLDLIHTRTLNSIEISCSVVSSEKKVGETDDFSSKFSLSGSFLLEDSNESSPAREVSCHSTVDVAGFVSHTVSSIFTVKCKVQLSVGRSHQRLNCFPVSCHQN
ncbi:hypothetical protein SLE2022_318960 [Rubroshorea leprosula]